MKYLVAGLWVVCGMLRLAHGQRECVPLDRGWGFVPGWETRARAEQPVDLPHTWNHDALTGRKDYYRGMGNYSRVVEVPAGWKDKRVFIRIGGANSVCDLYVNGRHVGQHRGGYTAFGWEITDYLNYGARNAIWARVSNAQDLTVAPLAGEFNVYGGLHRGVELIVVPDAYIGDQAQANGLHVTPTEITHERATVHVWAPVGGTRGGIVNATLVVRDAAGQAIDSIKKRIKLDDEGHNRIAAVFEIENPRRWNGRQDPYLYTAQARVETMKGYDSVSQAFGLRTVRVDQKNRFCLNDTPMQVRGVVRIGDRAMRGNALHRADHRRDVELMLEMGVNAVRVAYFPADPYFLELCDRAGILVWSELPFTGTGPYRGKGYIDNEALRANLWGQLRELIAQQYNHPSVVWWGLFDQLTRQGDDPLALVRELNRYAKEEGGGRLTVAASNQDGELNFVTDLVGFNQFMGWTAGRPEEFETWTRDLRRGFPALHSGVSGYGAGADPYQHAADSTLQRPDAAGTWHPEQWQTRLHEQYWRVMASGAPFWGTFVWTMFDYGWAAAPNNDGGGVVDKGLVSFDRALKKDAFYFYKANWNPADPFVYITARRWDERRGGRQTIKVYSNLPEVTLSVNGTPQGVRQNDGLGRFVWEGITLSQGENTVEAFNPASGVRDQIVIRIF